MAFCSYWMIVPATAESVQGILQPWQEHIMATEEVCSIGDIEEALFFKVVENIIVMFVTATHRYLQSLSILENSEVQ